MIAKAIAASLNATFFEIKDENIKSSEYGGSVQNVAALFDVARSKFQKSGKPSIIFIDEAESILAKRGKNLHKATAASMTAFLKQIEGVSASATESDGVFTIAATNTPWDIDSAIQARLGIRGYVPKPSPEARRHMFDKYFKKTEKGKLRGKRYPIVGVVKSRVEWLVQKTEGYAFRDLNKVFDSARTAAIQDFFDKCTDESQKKDLDEAQPIAQKHFENALKGAKTVGTLCNEKYFTEWAAGRLPNGPSEGGCGMSRRDIFHHNQNSGTTDRHQQPRREEANVSIIQRIRENGLCWSSLKPQTVIDYVCCFLFAGTGYFLYSYFWPSKDNSDQRTDDSSSTTIYGMIAGGAAIVGVANGLTSTCLSRSDTTESSGAMSTIKRCVTGKSKSTPNTNDEDSSWGFTIFVLFLLVVLAVGGGMFYFCCRSTSDYEPSVKKMPVNIWNRRVGRRKNQKPHVWENPAANKNRRRHRFSDEFRQHYRIINH